MNAKSSLGSFLPSEIKTKYKILYVVPNVFGTREWFYGRQLFHGLDGWGWFGDYLKALHLLWTLFIINIRSSGIKSQNLGTPVKEDIFKRHFMIYFKLLPVIMWGQAEFIVLCISLMKMFVEEVHYRENHIWAIK